jgi:DNA-binding MarR family transcriptional regulator
MADTDAVAVRDLVASATVFASTVNDLMEERLRAVTAGRVTFPQLKVLTLVARTTAPSVSDVATFLGISTAAASKTVDRLVRAGLLSRTAASEDRRTLELSLTRQGEMLVTRYEAETEEALSRALEEASPGEARRTASLLDRLSLMLIDAVGGNGACFRCGIHFRNHCLLRDRPGSRTCYLHLGERPVAGRGVIGSAT